MAGSRAIIAERLASLGHRPDYLDAGAIGALLQHSNGSSVTLRAALTSTLFLASTEDALQVDSTLVDRALFDSTPPKHSRTWRSAVGGFVAVTLAVAAVAAVLVARLLPDRAPPVAQAPPTARVEAPRSSGTLSRALPAQAGLSQSNLGNPAAAIPVHHPPTVVVKPAPQIPPLLPNLPPPVTVRAPPLPPQAAALVTAPVLPPGLTAGPPSRVVLLVSPRTVAGAALGGLEQRLRAAGMTDVQTRPSTAAPPRRPVHYFYAEDLPLALTASAALAGQGWPHILSNSLVPQLVLLPPGLPPRPPGQIEIQLP